MSLYCIPHLTSTRDTEGSWDGHPCVPATASVLYVTVAKVRLREVKQLAHSANMRPPSPGAPLGGSRLEFEF
jgi:hypothetical protein